MSFLYYLPGATVGTTDRDVLRRAGLEPVFRDALATQPAFQERVILHQVHANGPGEIRSGVIACFDGEHVKRVGYYPDEQTWINCGLYWLGHAALPIPPEQLARPTVVPGYEVVLGDGNVWQAATIRRGGVAPNLPRSFGMDQAGQFAMQVMPAYAWAWELGQQIFDKVFGSPQLAWSEAFRLCVESLSINYRIGMREAAILGLLNTENFQRVFDAAVDWDLVKELLQEEEGGADQKKSDPSVTMPASVSSSAGLPVVYQIIPPVLENCI